MWCPVSPCLWGILGVSEILQITQIWIMFGDLSPQQTSAETKNNNEDSGFPSKALNIGLSKAPSVTPVPKGSIDGFLSLLWPHLLPGALVLHLGQTKPLKNAGKGGRSGLSFGKTYFQRRFWLVSGEGYQKNFGMWGFVSQTAFWKSSILGKLARVSKHGYLYK